MLEQGTGTKSVIGELALRRGLEVHVVLVLMLALATSNAASAAVFRVNCTGVGGAALTINAGIAAAVAAGGQNAVIVEACGMPYMGTVVFGGVNDLQVIAEAPVGVKDVGVGNFGGAPPIVEIQSSPGQPCVDITNSYNVSLHGFLIAKCDAEGVRIGSSDFVTLLGNQIGLDPLTHPVGAGIGGLASERVEIIGNLVVYSGLEGILLDECVDSLIFDNVIARNGENHIPGTGFGIHLVRGYKNRVANNMLRGNPLAGAYAEQSENLPLFERNTGLANGGAFDINAGAAASSHCSANNATINCVFF